MQKIVFLTNYFPESTRELYEKLGFIKGGENISYIQNALLEGIHQNYGLKTEVLNKLLVKKGDGKKFVMCSEWEDDVAVGKNFKYLNLPFFSSQFLFFTVKKHLKKFSEKDYAEAIFISYALTDFNMRTLRYIKRKNRSALTGMIVPDLPELTKDGNGILSRIKNGLTDLITEKLIKKSAKYIDGYFLFSEKMKNRLPCEDKYVVFEGLSTDTFANVKPERIVGQNDIAVFYGGGMHKKYGAKLLFDAFNTIDDERFHLVLCGEGDYVDAIKQSGNPRVHCLGRIPRERLLSLQLGSNVLVNPRTNGEVFSDYSFPSKNMEYLSSGVPTVGFKLGGIPDEYDRFLNYPEEETAEALAKKIYSVATSPDAKKTAAQAKEFVLENKNKFVQSKKIVDYLMKKNKK